jgi:2-desacetyl-2-hydroxyethyl bacteriochlorophyllide A dehydrogenase
VRAVQFTAVGQIDVVTVDDPTPGRRDVVIKVAGAGICGTDLHILEGEFAPSLPIIPGHEFAGEVVAIGPDVSAVTDGIRVGDQVGVDPSLYCHECYYCRRGRGNMCERWGAIGVTVAGGAAEYAVAPVPNCIKLPAGVKPADAALIEPLSCAVRGFDVLPRMLGDHYLIYGAGTMGLMNLELAKRAGAASVDVIDLNSERLKTAVQLGVSSSGGSAEELNAPSHGWDVVIDCTGVVAAIEDGLSRVGKGGTFLQFGVSAEKAEARWAPYKIYNQEITITGSMAVLHSYERAVELFAGGVLDPDVFISDRYPLEQYETALQQFTKGIGRKIQVNPNS